MYLKIGVNIFQLKVARVCCVSQTRVMLRAIALVIFPSFQSGLHPDDGHALQSSLDLRPKWRVLP